MRAPVAVPVGGGVETGAGGGGGRNERKQEEDRRPPEAVSGPPLHAAPASISLPPSILPSPRRPPRGCTRPARPPPHLRGSGAAMGAQPAHVHPQGPTQLQAAGAGAGSPWEALRQGGRAGGRCQLLRGRPLVSVQQTSNEPQCRPASPHGPGGQPGLSPPRRGPCWGHWVCQVQELLPAGKTPPPSPSSSKSPTRLSF